MGLIPLKESENAVLNTLYNIKKNMVQQDLSRLTVPRTVTLSYGVSEDKKEFC